MEPRSSAEPTREFFRARYLLASAAALLVYLAVLAIVPTPWLEAPFGIFLLLLAPGYALASLLFPGASSLHWSIQVALTAGLSVTFNVLLGLLPLALHAGLPPAVFAGAAFILTLWALAVRLRAAEQGAEGLRTIASQAFGLSGFSRRERGGAYALLAATAVVLLLIAYLASTHPNVHPGIALALEGPGGAGTAIPSGGAVGEVLAVWVSITNNASAQPLVLKVQSVNLSAAPAPFHLVPWTQPLRLGNATQSSDAFNLLPDQTYTLNFTFTYTFAGTYAIALDLTDAAGTTLRTAEFSAVIR
ncbi:MAG TPA: DUF1616 domain-containing protein [Thermoplasmata archaeon]|nr:DUF1616 domain-containing protein [Thermoplasmata archaeon]